MYEYVTRQISPEATGLQHSAYSKNLSGPSNSLRLGEKALDNLSVMYALSLCLEIWFPVCWNQLCSSPASPAVIIFSFFCFHPKSLIYFFYWSVFLLWSTSQPRSFIPDVAFKAFTNDKTVVLNLKKKRRHFSHCTRLLKWCHSECWQQNLYIFIYLLSSVI